jgi:DNA-3-methyladenine glycosylase II
MLFNTCLDLEPFYRRVRRDGVMKRLTRSLRGLRSPSTLTVFEALVDSIIEQQISLAVGIIMEYRLIRSFGEPLTVDGNEYFAFPTPGRLVSMTLEQSRKIGLSSRKSEYIRGVSQLIVDDKLDLEKFKIYEDTPQIIRLSIMCEASGHGRLNSQ